MFQFLYFIVREYVKILSIQMDCAFQSKSHQKGFSLMTDNFLTLLRELGVVGNKGW